MSEGPSHLLKLRWVQDLLALGWPVVLYWVICVFGLICFSVAIAITQNFSSEDVLLLSAMWGGTAVGVTIGQVASVTRVRSCFFAPAALVGLTGAVWLMAEAQPTLKAIFGEEGGPMVMLGLFMGTLMAAGGFWSLRVNRGLMAVWSPAMLFCAAIIIITEDSDLIANWHEGAKYAIWSGGTGLILLLMVLLLVLYMAARERHRLHRWRTAPLAPELVQSRPDPVRPLSGLGTFLMLGMLILVLTGTSAVVAPYLWRTGPGDGGDGTEISDGDPEEEQEAGGNGWAGGKQILKQVQRGVSMTCSLITMLVLALAGLFVFGVPLRRQVLITHLRAPLWPVPPSRRARLHWRLAEIAVGDMGIQRLPGETARDVATRAVAHFDDINLEALITAAEISDRVAYGYALGSNDADTIRRAAEMTYQAVWESLGELQRLRATYRFL